MDSKMSDYVITKDRAYLTSRIVSYEYFENGRNKVIHVKLVDGEKIEASSLIDEELFNALFKWHSDMYTKYIEAKDDTNRP